MPLNLAASVQPVTVKSGLVHQIDSQWHHIELSIVCIYDKLVGLGFVYYNEEISIVESEEKQKYV